MRFEVIKIDAPNDELFDYPEFDETITDEEARLLNKILDELVADQEVKCDDHGAVNRQPIY